MHHLCVVSFPLKNKMVFSRQNLFRRLLKVSSYLSCEAGMLNKKLASL